MKEIKGNIWNYKNICITTNGVINSNGYSIMGKGIALEAKNKYPELPQILGKLIKEKGNHVYILKPGIFSFPTKNHWKDKSNLVLIEQSCKELLEILDDPFYGINDAILPRPGCGNGGLKWENVKQILEKYLDDRFTIISN